MKLYEIANELNELQAMLDDGDMTAEQLADTLEAVNMEFNDKVKGCCQIMSEQKAAAYALKNEANRMLALAAINLKSADLLKDYIAYNMESLGKDKIDTGLFKLTLRKPSVQLGELDLGEIPEDYWLFIPADVKLDRKALLSAAKVNDIPGVTLGESKRSLTIK